MVSEKARELAERIFNSGPVVPAADLIDAAVEELREAAEAYLYAPSPVEVVNRAARLRAALKGWTK